MTAPRAGKLPMTTRDLDRAVATAMGYRVIHRDDGAWIVQDRGAFFAYVDNSSQVPQWSPTTTPADWFAVVEQMQDLGYTVELCGSSEGYWRVRFAKDGKWTEQPTILQGLGFAICRAALAALGG